MSANLTDVTQADQAAISIPTDDANMAIQGNVAMKVITFEPMHYRLRGDIDKKGAKNWQK